MKELVGGEAVLPVLFELVVGKSLSQKVQLGTVFLPRSKASRKVCQLALCNSGFLWKALELQEINEVSASKE